MEWLECLPEDETDNEKPTFRPMDDAPNIQIDQVCLVSAFLS